MSDVQLSGRLVCRRAEEAAVVVAHLPEHIALTQAEPGCLSFDVTATSDPLIWQVEERFRNEDAYFAHQQRVASSDWGARTAGIERHYTVRTARD